jgi:hypothetical protein
MDRGHVTIIARSILMPIPFLNSEPSVKLRARCSLRLLAPAAKGGVRESITGSPSWTHFELLQFARRPQ